MYGVALPTIKTRRGRLTHLNWNYPFTEKPAILNLGITSLRVIET